MKYRQEAFDYWGERLPKTVRMRKTVRPDFPQLCKDPTIRCIEGEEYFVELNQYGAVSVKFHDDTLGLKPNEFDVIEDFIPSFEQRFDK